VSGGQGTEAYVKAFTRKCRWILQKRKVAKKDQETVKNLADVWIDFISVGYHAHLWVKVGSLSFTPLGVQPLYSAHTF